MVIFTLASMILMILALLTPERIAAQEDESDDPYYLVQEGNSLWGISNRFGISLEELQTANNLNDPNQLTIGMRLSIPGLSGVNGRVDARLVSYGDTLESLSRWYQTPEETLVQLNRITSPTELMAGSYIVVPVENEQNISYQQINLAPGQSLLELAVQLNSNPWEWLLDNHLRHSWAAIPGSPIQTRIPTERDDGFPVSG